MYKVVVFQKKFINMYFNQLFNFQKNKTYANKLTYIKSA
jgi:hypothetical protein